MKTATKPRAKSPIIRHLEFIPGGIHYFEMDASRRDQKHVQEVDLHTSHVRCSCEHFIFKLAPSEPTLGTPDLLCKHLNSAVEWLLDNSCIEAEDLQILQLLHEFQPCDRCFMPDADIPICDEQGRLTEGFMCRECAAELRAANELWSPHAQELRAQIAALETRREALQTELAQMPDLESIAHGLTELEARLMQVWGAYLACEPRTQTR